MNGSPKKILRFSFARGVNISDMTNLRSLIAGGQHLLEDHVTRNV